MECVKKKGGGGHAKVTKVLFEQENANGNILIPSQSGFETFKVGSPAVGGLSTVYTVEGLLDSEFPIIGKVLLVYLAGSQIFREVLDEIILFFCGRSYVPTYLPTVLMPVFSLLSTGTYVDPRILPGFKYIVRRLDSVTPLFDGRALKLVSVGVGYGKRISFEPDEGCLNDPRNYFWSDSASQGFA